MKFKQLKKYREFHSFNIAFYRIALAIIYQNILLNYKYMVVKNSRLESSLLPKANLTNMYQMFLCLCLQTTK